MLSSNQLPPFDKLSLPAFWFVVSATDKVLKQVRHIGGHVPFPRLYLPPITNPTTGHPCTIQIKKPPQAQYEHHYHEAKDRAGGLKGNVGLW